MNSGTLARTATGRLLAGIPWLSLLVMIVVFYPPVLKPFAWITGQAPWELGLLDSVAEGSATRRLQLGILAVTALGLLAFRRSGRSVRPAANSLGWLVALFAGLVVASVLWSDARPLSARRVVAMGIIGLAAFAYRTMPRESFLRLVFFTTLAGVLFGLAREIMRGSFRPWDPLYRFTGTLSTPNVQGWNCALVVLSGLALVHGLRRWRLGLILLVPLASLYLTRSRTSIAAFIGALLLYIFLHLLRGRRLMLVASLFVAAAGAVAVLWMEQSANVLEESIRLGREDSGLETFQGRTELWEEVLIFAHARPWLGYGYDVFWTSERIEDFSRTLGWMNQNGHSNYLDVLLGIGYPGLALFVWMMGLALWRASRCAVGSGNSADLFAAALIGFCVLHSFLETTLVGPLFLTLVFLVEVVRLGFPTGASGGAVASD